MDKYLIYMVETAFLGQYVEVTLYEYMCSLRYCKRSGLPYRINVSRSSSIDSVSLSSVI